MFRELRNKNYEIQSKSIFCFFKGFNKPEFRYQGGVVAIKFGLRLRSANGMFRELRNKNYEVNLYCVFSIHYLLTFAFKTL